MRHTFFIFLFLFSIALTAQNPARKQFKKLSRPEKCWVIAHPSIAKQALIVTKKVISDVDSIKKTGTIGTDLNGGNLDAFKHAYWMASLTLSIGSRQALKLGKAHEKGNYLDYKKHRLEDAILPDSVSSAMDYRNNEAGAGCIGRCHFRITANELQLLIMEKLKDGELYMIKKDEHGNYLTCDEHLIDMNAWKGKWGIPKCLIASDQH